MLWLDAFFRTAGADVHGPAQHTGAAIKLRRARTAQQYRGCWMITRCATSLHCLGAHFWVQLKHSEAVLADHQRVSRGQHGSRAFFTVDGDEALRAIGDHTLAIQQLDGYRAGIDPLFEKFEDSGLAFDDRDRATNGLGRKRFELELHTLRMAVLVQGQPVANMFGHARTS